jgi:hypothetical protein
MGKTKRNASRWFETRFKLGDPRFPEDNAEFLDGRYQAKMRNGNRSYYSMEIDPLSYKVASWREYGKWAKRDARQAARHNAKLLIVKMTHEIMRDFWEDYYAIPWEDDDDWYDEDYMGFDFSYSDEAYVYAERRRFEELMDEQNQRDWWSTYDPYEDWDY